MDNLAYENEFVQSLGDSELKKPPKGVENVNNSQSDQNVKVYTFEEALELIGTGKFHYFLQVICGIALMSANIETMSIGITMPFIINDIPSTIAEQGFLVSSSLLGIVMSSHAVGFLSDTWGRVKMLRATLSLSFITSIISAFSTNIWTLIAFRFLTGLIISANQGSIYSFVGEFHSNKTRTKYITMFSVFVPLAMVVMPALAIVILPLKLNPVFGMYFASWRLLLIANVSVRIIPVIGLFALPESPKFMLMRGETEQTLKTLRKMFSINTGRSVDDYPVQQIYAEKMGGKLNSANNVKGAIMLIWKQTIPLFYRKRILQTFNISLIMFIMGGVAQGTFMWIPTIIKEQISYQDRGLTTCEIMNLSKNVRNNFTLVEEITTVDEPVDTTMFLVLIVIGVAFTISYFTIALVIDWIGKRKVMFTWILLSGCSCLAVAWITHFETAVVFLNFISSLNTCIGIVSTVAITFFPTSINGMAMCLVMMIARIGSVAGGNIYGLLLFTNCEILFYLYFVLCAVVLVLVCLLPRQ